MTFSPEKGLAFHPTNGMFGVFVIGDPGHGERYVFHEIEGSLGKVVLCTGDSTFKINQQVFVGVEEVARRLTGDLNEMAGQYDEFIRQQHGQMAVDVSHLEDLIAERRAMHAQTMDQASVAYGSDLDSYVKHAVAGGSG